VSGLLRVRLSIPNAFSRSMASLHVFVNHVSPLLVQVDMSELAKADGALTCCSLLLH